MYHPDPLPTPGIPRETEAAYTPRNCGAVGGGGAIKGGGADDALQRRIAKVQTTYNKCVCVCVMVCVCLCQCVRVGVRAQETDGYNLNWRQLYLNWRQLY